MLRNVKNGYVKIFGKLAFFTTLMVVLSLIYFFNSDLNPNILSISHPKSSIKNFNGAIVGKFVADENYLGIISIRFNTINYINGSSTFKLKNILDKDWYHVATIAAIQYNAIPYYSFGIPVIAKSKNQTYVFELSLDSNFNKGSSLKLSDIEPVLTSQYQFPKNVLINNYGLFFEFVRKKVTNYLLSELSGKIFFVYSLPIIIYIIILFTYFFNIKISRYIVSFKENISIFLRPYLFFILLFIFLDIFIIRKSSSYIVNFIAFIWVIGIAAYKLNSQHTFYLVAIFLILSPFLIYAGMTWISDKVSVWILMFFTIATFHYLIELIAIDHKKINKFFIKFCSFFLPIYNYDRLIINKLKTVKQYAFFSIFNLIKSILMLIVLVLLCVTSFSIYLKAMSYRDRQLKNPRIAKIEPGLLYPATKVVLYGDSFGDNSNTNYALMRNGVPINVDYWEDHKIIFTVPLDWKSGDMRIWIQRPIEWNAETIIEKSKPFTIKLLKVTSGFTPDDDLYFEEMKNWRKETKEINGYK